ncbi:MAG: MGMT family protein [Victivallales bacterium]
MGKSLFIREKGLCLELEYLEKPGLKILSINFRKSAGESICKNPRMKKFAGKLSLFLSGKDPHFDKGDFALLDIERLTPFSQKVLFTLFNEVPRGKVVSYKHLSELSGFPNAVRAVGSAMAKNPFPLVIPCHRVIKSDGSPGNYGPGKKLKEHFLKLEKGKI